MLDCIVVEVHASFFIPEILVHLNAAFSSAALPRGRVLNVARLHVTSAEAVWDLKLVTEVIADATANVDFVLVKKRIDVDNCKICGDPL